MPGKRKRSKLSSTLTRKKRSHRPLPMAPQASSSKGNSSGSRHGSMMTLPGQYLVERILEKRNVSPRKSEFLVKWLGFDDKHNTWEPEENLSNCCAIRDFEIRQESRNLIREEHPEPLPEPVDFEMPDAEEDIDDDIRGFDRGLDAEAIVGATECNKELCFLMKWHGSNVVDLVPAREVREKCPQVLIQFYSRQVRWNKK